MLAACVAGFAVCRFEREFLMRLLRSLTCLLLLGLVLRRHHLNSHKSLVRQ